MQFFDTQSMLSMSLFNETPSSQKFTIHIDPYNILLINDETLNV